MIDVCFAVFATTVPTIIIVYQVRGVTMRIRIIYQNKNVLFCDLTNCETHTNVVLVVSVYITKYEFVESKYRKHLYIKLLLLQ